MVCGHDCIQQCCHENACDEFECKVQVLKQLRCGHQVKLKCFQKIDKYICEKKVLKELKCMHKEIIPCFQKIDDFKFNISVLKNFFFNL